MATFLRQCWTVAAKDLRSELRTKEALNASFSFAIVVLVLFSFAFDASSDTFQELSGGLLWLTYSFAGALALNRSFVREIHNDCLDALVGSPVPASAIFGGKALANFALLMAVELFSLPFFAVFYGLHPLAHFGSLLLVMLLGSWGITVIGTMFSALTVNLRLRELMLPTLVYPILIPVLIGAMLLTTDLLSGKPIGSDNRLWIWLLLVFDFIFTLLGLTLVDTVLVG